MVERVKGQTVELLYPSGQGGDSIDSACLPGRLGVALSRHKFNPSHLIIWGVDDSYIEDRSPGKGIEGKNANKFTRPRASQAAMSGQTALPNLHIHIHISPV